MKFILFSFFSLFTFTSHASEILTCENLTQENVRYLVQFLDLDTSSPDAVLFIPYGSGGLDVYAGDCKKYDGANGLLLGCYSHVSSELWYEISVSKGRQDNLIATVTPWSHKGPEASAILKCNANDI